MEKSNPSFVPCFNSVMNLNSPQNMSLLENVVWTISNLCRGSPSPANSITAPVIYPLVSFLDKDISEGAKVDILWALSYLSDGEEQNIESVIATGVTHMLMRLLGDETTKVRCKTPIVRILGNFVSGSDRQTQVVIESGILDQLATLMGSQSKTIRKESSWLASNIACGNHDQITQLMKRKQALKQIIINATEDSWEVRKEAVWALSHICTSGNDMHVASLVEAGGLEPLVMVLSMQNADTALLVSAIDALRKILKVGEVNSNAIYQQRIDEYNGIEYLEELQEHPSNTVYEKVVALIEDYFGVAEEEDENLAPETNECGTFGFGLASPKQLFPTGNFSSEMISGMVSTKEVSPFGNVSTNTFYPV
jgi:importin subunit alpha-1